MTWAAEMEHGLNVDEETVDEVLQEVLDDAERYADRSAEDSDESTEHIRQHTQPDLLIQPIASNDQALRDRRSSDTVCFRGPDAPEATVGVLHLPSVFSALNPLFQPVKPVRQQSAQLQRTLSSMTRQLSALEDSMQHPASQLGSSCRSEPAQEDAAQTGAFLGTHRCRDPSSTNNCRHVHVEKFCTGVLCSNSG